MHFLGGSTTRKHIPQCDKQWRRDIYLSSTGANGGFKDLKIIDVILGEREIKSRLNRFTWAIRKTHFDAKTNFVLTS